MPPMTSPPSPREPPSSPRAKRRARLLAAMVREVVAHGYEGITVSGLVARARVSKRDFYAEFGSKEECFLAAFERIVGEGAARIGGVHRLPEGREKRLEAVLEELVEATVEHPAASRLVLVDSLSLGAGSIEVRERAEEDLENLIRGSIDGEALSEAQARAVVGGLRSIFYRALREGRPEGLSRHTGDLAQWAAGYAHAAEQRAPGRPSAGERLAAAAEEGSGGSGEPEPGPPWEELPNSPRSRAELSQRERIMRAAAQVAVSRGYAALSIPAISAMAGTSNQTFYEQFGSAQEAFLAALETLTGRAFEAVAAAVLGRESWLEGGAAGIVALLRCFVERPLFRDLAFFALPESGTAGRDRAEALLRGFAAFLAPDPLPPGVPRRPPPIALEAIAGGLWAVVRKEVVAGRAESLPELAPELIDVVLVPFGVLE